MRLLLSAGAGYSHIAPMLPLARAAQRAGHDVRFVTGPGAGHQIEAAGLRAIELGPPLDPAMGGYLERYPREQLMALAPDARLAHLVRHYVVEIAAAERLDEMLALVRAWSPDLIVTTLVEQAAVMAAVATGVPYAIHAIGPPKAAAILDGGWEAAGRILAARGVERMPARDDVPYLDVWPAALRPTTTWAYPRRWPLRPDGVGPATDDRPAVLDDLPFARTAYVTCGTSHNARPGVLEAMVDGVRDAGVNVVATIGRDGDPDRFRDAPDHVRVVPWVAQQELLPHVDVVVCHGGAGSVIGALAHGRPLVVCPLTSDHLEAAEQVAAAGAGAIGGTTGPSAEAVREAFGAVAGERRYHDAAAAIGREIATMPAVDELLGRLEAYAS